MKAILSDIHGNLEALQAVLADCARQGVETIYCLGDLVGFGPNPRECVDLAMSWPVVLLGDHDQAVTAETTDSVLWVHQGLVWTRAQLMGPVEDIRAGEQRRQYLVERPRLHREAEGLFVHASPSDPLCEYIFPEDIYCPGKMERLFSLFERYCFVGHTHLPGIFTEDGQFLSTEEVGPTFQLGGRKTLINVGSVGQPRDGDWRACYVLFDGDRVHFRRVEYDVAATVRKIHLRDGD